MYFSVFGNWEGGNNELSPKIKKTTLHRQEMLQTKAQFKLKDVDSLQILKTCR